MNQQQLATTLSYIYSHDFEIVLKDIEEISKSVNSEEFNEFVELVKKRTLVYIQSLKKLKADWISPGESFAPTPEILEKSKEILFLILFKVAVKKINQQLADIPHIVLCPLPSGGFGFELQFKKDKLYLEIHNNGEYQLSKIDQFEYYSEISLDEENTFLSAVESVLYFV